MGDGAQDLRETQPQRQQLKAGQHWLHWSQWDHRSMYGIQAPTFTPWVNLFLNWFPSQSSFSSVQSFCCFFRRCLAAAEAGHGSRWCSVSQLFAGVSGALNVFQTSVCDKEGKPILCVPGRACVLCGSFGIALTSAEGGKLSVDLVCLMQRIIKQMLSFVCVC